MKMRMGKRLAIGAAAGLAVNQIVCWVASYALKLGYFAACMASMPERVGGEMNAVLLQMVAFMLVGMGASVAGDVVRSVRRLNAPHVVAVAWRAHAAPIAVWVACMLHGIR